MSSIINCWFGRFGNNIIQIINCLYFSTINNISNIKFPKHDFLTNTEIIINENINNDNLNNKNVYDTFYYLDKLNLDSPSPVNMKKLAIKYILPILNKGIYIDGEQNTKNDLYIHIRGGDIFTSNPHPKYVQPPLYYYYKIINDIDYNNINIIYEDNRNPCVNYLMNNKEYNFYSGKLSEDIKLLLSASSLVIGCGTFGFAMYLLNPSLKKLFIPDYALDFLPKGDWGDIELIKFNLPNYIKLGEWVNTKSQQDIMINYKILPTYQEK